MTTPRHELGDRSASEWLSGGGEPGTLVQFAEALTWR